MDAIRYLDADTILDYLHNSSETYLEGLIPQSYGFPTETDRSVYVRLLKVPVRDKASEVYMQAIPYVCLSLGVERYPQRRERPARVHDVCHPLSVQ